MTTMLQTLDETAAAYTSNTRAFKDGSGCRYFTDGKCCAIGRCLENPVEFQDVDISVGGLNLNYNLELILKPEYRGFSLEFWAALQGLHDLVCNWDTDGLSEDGRMAVNNIKRKFKL